MDGGECVAECNTTEFEVVSSNTCETTCTVKTHYVDSQTGLQYCVDECPPEYWLKTKSSHECVNSCSTEYEVKNITCEETCSAVHYYRTNDI